MPRYRVSYKNVINGTPYTVEMTAPTWEDAERGAADVLTAHVRATAGRMAHWTHQRTETLGAEGDGSPPTLAPEGRS